MLVHEDAHQFRDRQRRVRVVELEDVFLRQLSQILVAGFQILLDHALDRSGDEEILLLQAQLLALHVVVAGIEDVADRAREVLLLHCLLVVALVEGLQVEQLDGLRIPDAQRVDEAVAVADDREIVRDSLDCRIAFLLEHRPAVLAGIRRDVAAEVDLLLVLGPAQLERVAVREPVVRHFDLVAVLDLLLEHAVVVADAAAVRRVVQGRERVEEAGGKPSEAAVAERRIRLLVFDRVDVEAELLERFLHFLVSAEVDRVVAERAPHQEFHGQVDDLLGILLVKRLLRLHPAVDDLVL